MRVGVGLVPRDRVRDGPASLPHRGFQIIATDTHPRLTRPHRWTFVHQPRRELHRRLQPPWLSLSFNAISAFLPSHSTQADAQR